MLLPCPPDFDLRATVLAHGWKSLAPFTWDDEHGRLATVAHCAGRVVTLGIEEREGRVAVDVPGGGADPAVAEAARRAAAWMLRLDEDLADFHAFCLSRPELRHIAGNRQGRLLRSPTLFEDAVKTILTTNTTWAQTKAMARRLVDLLGAPSEDGARAFPTPEAIAACPEDQFAAGARLGYRNRYVQALARQVAEGELDLEALAASDLGSTALAKRLRALPGFGPYGAAHLANLMGRYGDIPCDSWARTQVSRHLKAGEPAIDADVRAFFTRYHPWPFLVYRFFLWDGAQAQARALEW